VLIHDVEVDPDGVRVSGWIVHGWGASKKLRHWRFILDQKLELERGKA
jgi:MarR-like DNA-binding transcriptional regulator SgrR of sgrS sRNA